jgi:hypothetical protein
VVNGSRLLHRLRCVQYLAKDGAFDDSELKEFLADLAAMRRADLG